MNQAKLPRRRREAARGLFVSRRYFKKNFVLDVAIVHSARSTYETARHNLQGARDAYIQTEVRYFTSPVKHKILKVVDK